MTLLKQTMLQATLLAGQLEGPQERMLEMFCNSAIIHLTARLRAGLTPEDCKAAFVASCALYALAAFTEIDPVEGMQRVQIGDVTLTTGGTDAAVRCLRKQADMIISPYCEDNFTFRGV